MATKTVLVDDIDQGEADRTVPFSLDGDNYEIDLSAKNRENLAKALAPFIAKARRGRATTRVQRSRSPRTGAALGPSNTAGRSDQLKAQREWARKNGWPNLSDKGRVPQEVADAFDAAHNNTPAFVSA